MAFICIPSRGPDHLHFTSYQVPRANLSPSDKAGSPSLVTEERKTLPSTEQCAGAAPWVGGQQSQYSNSKNARACGDMLCGQSCPEMLIDMCTNTPPPKSIGIYYYSHFTDEKMDLREVK